MFKSLQFFNLQRMRWFVLGIILFSLTFGSVAFAQMSSDRAAQDKVAQMRKALAPYPGTTHLLPATLETTQWGWFNNAQTPVLEISSGDTVVMETMMHSHNQVVPGKSIEELKKLRTDNPGRGPHTLTGPIFVKGAEPGDVLKVKILKIEPRSYAANFNIPGMFGQFPDKFPEGQVKYLYLDMDKKVTTFSPGIQVPISPFPGTLGVARAEAGQYSSVPPGPYAGNLDIRDFKAGATLYVPVFVKGALLWTGDSHAGQGNGEINLTAMESAFKEIVLNVSVVKGQKLDWPRIETPTQIITVGIDKDLNKALANAKVETAKFLADQRQVSVADAGNLMAEVSDCRISQVVNINKGIHCLNPKNIKATKNVEYPTAETSTAFVTSVKNADLNKAMNEASYAMIELLQDKEKMTRLDAYGLASIAMDCRIGKMDESEKSVHCLIPKSLWLSKRV
ncbi:MAG: acetamidase/formamidase family protein [Pseudanabaena sp.]